VAELNVTGPARNVGAEGKIYLVEEKTNPSTDYFVLPAIAGCGEVVRVDFTHYPKAIDLEDATVIFVRYIPPPWVKLIEKARPRLGRLVLFMDDDVLDVQASTGMPWSYRVKLMRLAAWRKKWLRKQGGELWVSTPYLQKKYADWPPRLVLPSPVTPAPTITRRIFYHGSSSHLEEINWLRPIVENVLKSNESFSFEIIGDHEINRLYRDIPRVTVIHPMSWQSYQGLLAIPGRHIGLAPLLGNSFNQARSYTKFFDITRCGAVGIYSQNSVYTELVSNGAEGLLAGQSPEAWKEAIMSIADDEPGRQAMLKNAQDKMTRLASSPEDSRHVWEPSDKPCPDPEP
jgi:hypothetical protein